MQSFDISLHLDYLIQQNSYLEISKVYDIGLQRYGDYKIRVCDKLPIHLAARLVATGCSLLQVATGCSFYKL